MSKIRCIGISWLVIALAASAGVARAGSLPLKDATASLDGAQFGFTVDMQHGTLKTVRNIKTGRAYDLARDNVAVEIGDATMRWSDLNVQPIDGSNSIDFIGRDGSIQVELGYSFDPDKGYVDRHLRLRNVSGEKSVVIRRVIDGQLTFESPFESAHFHDDGMDASDPGTEGFHEAEKPYHYQCSLNVFMRGKKEGLFAGVKYPYFAADLSKRSMKLSYPVNVRLAPGETLELPTLFVGVYEKTGYTCRKELHWKPRILSTEQEEMDWGEVYAMREVLRDYLPEYPLPADGYLLWLNSWWANPDLRGRLDETGAHAYCRLAKQIRMAGCIDMMVSAPVWMGWAGFIEPAAEIDAIGEDAEFPMNPHIERVLSCARENDLMIWGFCEPHSLERHYRKDRPDWKLQPTPDPEKRLIQNCWANDQYAEWFFRLTCSVIDKCGLDGWAWDHVWTRRPMVCYDTSHGHEPGNCEFAQYRNITGYIQRLRERYPEHIFEIYWGLKTAGTWGHRGLNSLENIYENNSPAPPGMSAADDQRFQHWYNHNYRFFPTYMNLGQINFAKEANGHVYSILSTLSSTTHASLTDWVDFEEQERADKIFADLQRWKRWATDNMTYLRKHVDLFGQPCRKDGIDGTAHVIDDHGYLFVFNPWEETHWGMIELNEMIGLTVEGRYALSDISGSEPQRLGVVDHGRTFLFDMKPKSARLIEIRPTDLSLYQLDVPEKVHVQPAFRP